MKLIPWVVQCFLNYPDTMVQFKYWGVRSCEIVRICEWLYSCLTECYYIMCFNNCLYVQYYDMLCIYFCSRLWNNRLAWKKLSSLLQNLAVDSAVKQNSGFLLEYNYSQSSLCCLNSIQSLIQLLVFSKFHHFYDYLLSCPYLVFFVNTSYTCFSLCLLLLIFQSHV